MSLVVDASVVVTALTDTGNDGRWATSILRRPSLTAAGVLPAEVAHALRGLVHRAHLTSAEATASHRQVEHFPLALLPYRPVADRVWELRENVTPYDAWYVALAEASGSPLATLDTRLASAPGPTCTFLTPA